MLKKLFICQQILSHPRIKDQIPVIQGKLQSYESLFKKNFVKNSEPKELVTKYLHSQKLDVIRMEGEILGLNENSRVLILGSGSYPITAIMYSSIFKSKCTCEDASCL